MRVTKGDVVAGVLEGSGLGALLRTVGHWPGVLVLNYHRIGDGSHLVSDRGIWSATAAEFDAQMRFLAQHCTILTAEDLLHGPPARAGRFAMVTFDDGYRETYEVAYPILDRSGVRATFFLVTGFLDATHTAWWDEIAWMVRVSPRSGLAADEWLPTPVSLAQSDRRQAAHVLIQRHKACAGDEAESFLDHLARVTGSGRRAVDDTRADWMTWDMARDLVRGGMGVGGHTVTHATLGRLSRPSQESEITTCLDRLEQELGRRPRIFSYPEGLPDSFSRETVDCLQANGVELAFSNYGGLARGDRWNPYDVPRTVVAAVSVSRLRFRARATLPLLFIGAERRRFLRGG
jgi:peptidoglycan/xylan/chitin deacetylase (PgdA/CDA1 family)